VARILLVEDHATMRAAIRAILEPAGHDVVEVADGAAALEAVRTSPPDLVVLDLNIPGTPGEEVLHAIRLDPSASGIGIVVVTAAEEERRAEVMAAGADAYFTKPFGPAALLQTVSRVLGGSEPPAG
jgi:CheY-like chemotaxis protein